MPSEDTNARGEAAPQAEEARPGPEAHLDEWVAPDIADEQGFLRAGKILEWMDVVGVLAASRHCRRPVATASVDGMELLHPIRVGERVTMTAAVGYTSTRSLGVSVSMRHGTPAAEQRSLKGYMTFVALEPRRPHVSYVHKIEPVRASKLNFQGTLYGGTLMRWIETTANLSARAYLDGAPVRLRALHGLTFIRPVRRHVFVHVRSAV